MTEPVRLPYKIGGWGCCIGVFVIVFALIFSFAAFDSRWDVEEPSSWNRGRTIGYLVTQWRVGEFAPIAFVLAIFALFQTVRFFGRMFSSYAFEVREEGLETHWTTLVGPYAWSEIESIDLHKQSFSGRRMAAIDLLLVSGKRKRFWGVSLDQAEQERFLSAARDRLRDFR